ncbi:hypothetical protein [Pseudonocardia sp. ICBG601]|uniref:hypothetical protein n=1 Tax=Pseudonocardia sp. ICBG601 TaxID=2846759 RepID=UPI001CF6DE02|nr:hypothetical protein [Pseudonocardia sp. ICBG601]
MSVFNVGDLVASTVSEDAGHVGEITDRSDTDDELFTVNFDLDRFVLRHARDLVWLPQLHTRWWDRVSLRTVTVAGLSSRFVALDADDGTRLELAVDRFEDHCEPVESDQYVLDPDDPFESALLTMAAMNRRKRADYALDSNLWSNFTEVATAIGVEPLDVVNMNMEQKSSRLRALKSNDREPANESVIDSYLDRAVYACIAYAMARDDVA